MKIRAKMKVLEVTKNEYSERAKLTAVCGGSPEDNSFAQATPCAELTITIDNPAAQGLLIPGKAFYVDFTRVKEPAPAQPAA